MGEKKITLHYKIEAMPTWIEALKIYNAKGDWCVPKKGTPEYEDVRVIMRGGIREKPRHGHTREDVEKKRKLDELKEWREFFKEHKYRTVAWQYMMLEFDGHYDIMEQLEGYNPNLGAYFTINRKGEVELEDDNGLGKTMAEVVMLSEDDDLADLYAEAYNKLKKIYKR